MRFTLANVWTAAALIAASVCAGCASTDKASAQPEAVEEASHPRPDAIEPPTPAELDESIRRGVAFLVQKQNPDGSWGSARRTKGLNITAPVPGAHRGFRAATTALAVTAMIETGDLSDPAVRSSLERGEQWLIDNLPDVKRGSVYTIYNNWAHAYALHALAAMHRRADGDAARQQQIADLVALQYKRLDQYEFIGGGWGYYDFEHHTAQPGGSPTSFTTAAILVGMKRAADVGFDPPQDLVDAGVREILRERRPDGSFLYSRNWRIRPTGTVNQHAGSLGRSQVCNAALRHWHGDDPTTDAVLAEWLDRLFARNGWLDMGRKRPVPHESWFAVAGYFYYFGHFYAGPCIDLLPADRRPFYQAHLARTIMALQEADGSWWDYPLYDYHQPYGTAFALLSLARCHIDTPDPTVADRR